jgi:hypothetical protein
MTVERDAGEEYIPELLKEFTSATIFTTCIGKLQVIV